MGISERIADLRKKKALSQYQLAELLGVSRQAVSKWENGLAVPDMENLISLAQLLDVQLEYLATGKADPLPSPLPSERIVEVEKVIEVERIVEKIVEVEKPIYLELEKIVQTKEPIIKRIYRTRYIRNPLEFIAVGLLLFVVGLLTGLCF